MITFSSRFWSGTLSRIPHISMFFLPPYYSNESWSLSSEITLLSKSLTFFLSRWFLTWRFLMITSFEFSISLSKPSNVEINFFSKLKILSLKKFNGIVPASTKNHWLLKCPSLHSSHNFGFIIWFLWFWFGSSCLLYFSVNQKFLYSSSLCFLIK